MISSNELVPKQYAAQLKGITRKLGRNGGKGSIPGHKESAEWLPGQGLLGLAKRLSEVMVPKHGLLSVDKFRKREGSEVRSSRTIFTNIIGKNKRCTCILSTFIKMLFQHYACHVSYDSNTLILFGRSDQGSVALHTKLTPHLFFENVQDAEVTTGHNIVDWGERTFYKVTYENVSDYDDARQRPSAFDGQVEADSQWFIQQNLRPCSMFEVEVSPVAMMTHCDAEYNLVNIQPAEGYIPPVVLSYDIECVASEGFPDPEKDPVITIGCVSRETKCFCWKETPGYDWYPTEGEMIKAFLDYVQQVSPDILTGYNINRFDNTYIRTRCQVLGIPFKWSKLKGYRSSVKHFKTRSNQKGTQERYRLRTCVVVMDAMRLRENSTICPSTAWAACQSPGICRDDMAYHLTQESSVHQGRRSRKYCVKDCKLVVDLLEKLQKSQTSCRCAGSLDALLWTF